MSSSKKSFRVSARKVQIVLLFLPERANQPFKAAFEKPLKPLKAFKSLQDDLVAWHILIQSFEDYKQRVRQNRTFHLFLIIFHALIIFSYLLKIFSSVSSSSGMNEQTGQIFQIFILSSIALGDVGNLVVRSMFLKLKTKIAVFKFIYSTFKYISQLILFSRFLQVLLEQQNAFLESLC